jgi:hypothetical protein
MSLAGYSGDRQVGQRCATEGPCNHEAPISRKKTSAATSWMSNANNHLLDRFITVLAVWWMS